MSYTRKGVTSCLLSKIKTAKVQNVCQSGKSSKKAFWLLPLCQYIGDRLSSDSLAFRPFANRISQTNCIEKGYAYSPIA
jgi:hypothetical protein